VIALALACTRSGGAGDAPVASDPQNASAAPPTPAPDAIARSEVRATIVRVALRIADSHPPQVFVDVVSALEDGCTRFARTAVRREGNVVRIDVFNTRPAPGAGIACTMIYGEKETTVALGSDFVAGETYVVDVHGKRQTFVGQ
jgi:hypothetical protein